MTGALGQLTQALADRYRLERELGQGGMATVYLAEDLKHHCKVAVKVLRPELAAADAIEASGTRLYFASDRRESDLWTADVVSR
jgi:serine/threonine protein kinase